MVASRRLVQAYGAVVVMVAALSAGPSELQAQTVFLEEDFEDGMPAGWTQFTGSSAVQNGILGLSFGCLVLPEEFERGSGLRLEADVNITWQFAGDFNYFVFFDPFGQSSPHCFWPTGNGYDFAYYPVGSDNSFDAIRSTLNGNRRGLVTGPTVMTANNWHNVTAELLPDGTLRHLVDGELRLTTVNHEHNSGPVVLRTWGLVFVDNLRITSLCSFGPDEQPLRFNRTRGKPVWDSIQWESCGGEGVLRVSNEGAASALVYLNGELVLGPSDFSRRVEVLELPVELQEGQNALEVQLRSAPSSSLVMEFVQ